MALFTYIFYVLTTLAAGILIYCFLNQTKRSSRLGNSPSARYNSLRKALPLGKSNWRLISVEDGLRLWLLKSKESNKSLFASSAILPVSLKIVKDILTDPAFFLEWNPWVKKSSRISVSNEKESSQHSGDVISVRETSISLFHYLANIFKTDCKLYARTWHGEENSQFWLHSAVVEPCLADPLFTLFMVFPIRDNDENCQLIVASEAQSRFHTNTLTASLSAFKQLILHQQSVAVLPEIKDDQRDGAIADGHAVLVEKDEIDELEIESQNLGQCSHTPSEEFVDITGVYYSRDNAVQKYRDATDTGLKRLMECYCAKDGKNGWYNFGNIKDVEILKKPASADFSAWDCSKGTTEINVPLDYLLAYLDDMDRTGEYDDMFDKGQVVESLGDLTRVVYMEYKGIWPVSGRDFCSISAIRVLADGTVAFFAKHVEHPSCPPCKKYVRGKILVGGFVLKTLSEEPPRIRTTYITHVDLQGSVPSRIVNKVTANQPASVGIVKTRAEFMYQDELRNPDRSSQFKTAAMNMRDKLQRAREIIAKKTDADKVEGLGETPAPTVEAVNGDLRHAAGDQSNRNSPPFSPSITGSPFNNGGLDYKTIGNQASAGLMQEAFEVSEVDISKPSGVGYSVYEQWEYQETEKKVLIFRKKHESEKIHSFIGKGIIACSPPKVWEILKEPENAYRYNNMLKETRTLENLSDTQRIEYLHFQTEKCFKKEARDFIALRTERKETDKYLMSFVSVDYPNSPSKKDVKRGKIISSGWVIEPLLHNGQLYSMVTYLAQMNPGGSYPAMLVNTTGRKQPLCIAYLRRLVENPNQSLNQTLDESDHS